MWAGLLLTGSLDLFELTTGSTTIKPNTTTIDGPIETTAGVTTAPSGDCYNTPEDTLDCEHGCDTLIFECLSYCNHNTNCMAQCWREKDPDYCKTIVHVIENVQLVVPTHLKDWCSYFDGHFPWGRMKRPMR